MLAQFEMSIPLIAAPMSGGPTTPAMVSAATRAGGLGMLAAGYKTVEAVEAEIKKVRAEGIPFGINVFAPNPLPVDPDSYRTYAAIIQRDADRVRPVPCLPSRSRTPTGSTRRSRCCSTTRCRWCHSPSGYHRVA